MNNASVEEDFLEKYRPTEEELSDSQRIHRLLIQDNAKEDLDELRKTNIQNLALDRKTNYEMRFGLRSLDEPWMYMSSSYYGTGEGQTVCLMITQAHPRYDDFDRSGPTPDIPINSKEYRAVREFMDEFGTWHCHGLDFHTENDFFNEYGNYLPPIVNRLRGARCYGHFHTEVHYNFS